MSDPRRTPHQRRLAQLLTHRSMLALELSVRRKELGMLRESLRELQCEIRRVNLQIVEAHYGQPRLTLVFDRDRDLPASHPTTHSNGEAHS